MNTYKAKWMADALECISTREKEMGVSGMKDKYNYNWDPPEINDGCVQGTDEND